MTEALASVNISACAAFSSTPTMPPLLHLPHTCTRSSIGAQCFGIAFLRILQRILKEEKEVNRNSHGVNMFRYIFIGIVWEDLMLIMIYWQPSRIVTKISNLMRSKRTSTIEAYSLPRTRAYLLSNVYPHFCDRFVTLVSSNLKPISTSVRHTVPSDLILLAISFSHK